MKRISFRWFQFVCVLAFLKTLSISSDADAGSPSPDRKRQKFCESRICQQAGQQIYESIDHSTKPCVDFYQHACGRWNVQHPGIKSPFHDLLRDTNEKRKDLLEEISLNNKADDSTTMLRKLSDFYGSCTDFAAIDAKGLERLTSAVSKNGGWPLTFPSGKWQIQDHKLTLQQIHENYGELNPTTALFYFAVTNDKIKHGLHLKQDEQRAAKIRRTNANRYFAYAVAVAKKFSQLGKADVLDAVIKHEVAEMLEFEKSLHTLVKPGLTSSMTIEQVQKTWDETISGHPDYAIKWADALSKALHIDGKLIGNILVKDSSMLVRQGYISELGSLLKKYSLRTVVNYVHWNVISELASEADIGLKEILQGSKISGVVRSRSCDVNNPMDTAISYAYVKKYFKNFDGTRTAANNMMSRIQDKAGRTFAECAWVHDEWKCQFRDEIGSTVLNIGYPVWWDEARKIDEYYSKLIVDRSDYIGNLVSHMKFKRMQDLMRLGTDYDGSKMEWPLSPLKINARLIMGSNILTVPAVLFQPPFFHVDRPPSMNYGGIGFIMGHERAHTLDPNGQQLMKKRIKEQLHREHDRKLHEQASCFIDQYNFYNLKKPSKDNVLKVNGRNTVFENIADNEGIRLAYEAFMSYKKDNPSENMGVPQILKTYTDEQIFFYSYANNLCTYDPYNQSPDGKYAPNWMRTNIPLMNMPEFAEAFNCHNSMLMNPPKKCNLWSSK